MFFNDTKSFKRIVSISAAAVCMLSSLNVAPTSYLEADAANKVLSAFEITKEMKVGWNLGNTLDAYAQKPDPKDPEKSIPLDSAGLETETCWKNPKA